MEINQGNHYPKWANKFVIYFSKLKSQENCMCVPSQIIDLSLFDYKEGMILGEEHRFVNLLF